jgi:hypothetical protein
MFKLHVQFRNDMGMELLGLLNTRWGNFPSPSNDLTLPGFTMTSLPRVTDCENCVHSVRTALC